MRKQTWLVLSMLLAVTACYAFAQSPGPVEIDKESMKPQGMWVEVTWPDTLDLAERAELSLNVLTRNSDTDPYCTVFQSLDFGRTPPRLGAPGWIVHPSTLFSLPYVRTMCGGSEGLDVECKMMQAMLDQLKPDGLMYFPSDAGWPKGTSVPNYNGQMALTLLNWYERDKNPAWLDRVQLICKGLDKTAIRASDRAYYPLECGIQLDGAWRWTTRGKPILPYTPPDEPASDQQGYEGCAKWMTVGGPMEALAGLYRYRRDKNALDLATRFARFSLKPGMWQGKSTLAYPGNEHGIFAGHYTGNVRFLCALLDLGVAQKSEFLKQFAREGYEHTSRNGIVRMGWYPAWLMPEKFQRPRSLHGVSEGCGVAYTLILAVKLSDAGLSDYWDDVDAIVRNHLIEQQVTSLEVMRKMAGGNPQNDPLLERFVGGCGSGEPTAMRPEIAGCCSASTAAAFYYAWHGITRFDQGVAQVNLFLNRAAPWMDVESSLPHEGRVILRNKKAHTARVRVPRWVDANGLKCAINGNPVEPYQAGRHLLIESLKGGDVIELTFPVRERTDRYFIHDKTYTIRYRGSTVVDIAPRNTEANMVPLYQRANLQTTKAPMHTVQRFVADNTLPLQ